ncbi:MAG: 2-amino-4-hydroxy-6-hydroxymethyldihydropteridine diphosphokinase [Verrucomicrobiales bacterium]|nr:2-amino-4-hydroxy-6-hydroxymethyldihydropteridine diphosphokinase [Verrucomicrobiales bacterium]|tara:strand:- start:2571 stop:3071 length:501 start_codon:yes stop_codon:yes gene_type:complete
MNEWVIVALGSNLGDSRVIILDAMDRLESLGHDEFLRSSLWRTSPVDCPPESPDFVNAVVAFRPKGELSPPDLLAHLQSLEREFGRRPKEILNEPRPLDLDIIAFRNEVRSDAELTIPHPRSHLRRFVLAPLAELLPDYVAEGWTANVRSLLDRLEDGEEIDKICD